MTSSVLNTFQFIPCHITIVMLESTWSAWKSPAPQLGLGRSGGMILKSVAGLWLLLRLFICSLFPGCQDWAAFFHYSFCHDGSEWSQLTILKLLKPLTKINPFPCWAVYVRYFVLAIENWLIKKNFLFLLIPSSCK